MKIYELTTVTDAAVNAFRKLIPQLAPGIPAPDKTKLESVIRSGNTKIFMAEDDEIAGTLTLVFQETPTGRKAWIEDVVVDVSVRGKGTGEQLIRFAVDFALKEGVTKIDLTSGYGRVAANRLYLKLGFEKRETNVYRFKGNN